MRVAFSSSGHHRPWRRRGRVALDIWKPWPGADWRLRAIEMSKQKIRFHVGSWQPSMLSGLRDHDGASAHVGGRCSSLASLAGIAHVILTLRANGSSILHVCAPLRFVA
jgi:hypothetical protein